MRLGLATAAVGVLLVAGGAGCHASDDGFLWGAATAAYQVEGGLHGTDWYEWEQLGNIQRGESADDGPDELERFEDDLRLAADQLGHNAYRFSLDWSRIEPVEGQYDPEGLAYYHRVLKACRDHRLTPLVTLHHFATPSWLHEVQTRDPERLGWAGGGAQPGDGRIVAAFERFAGDMAEEFGAEVDLWMPLNEPMVLVTATYLNPSAAPQDRYPRPPFAAGEPLLDLTRAIHATTNLIFAHARAADAIRARDTVDADHDGHAALVGVAQHMRHFLPSGEGLELEAATARTETTFNYLFLDAVIRGDLDVTLDGRYDSPGERQGDPSLAGRLDFIGVNYYSRSEVFLSPIQAPSPYSSDLIVLTGLAGETTNFDGPKTELGWDIWPEGLYQVLTRTAQRYGLPLYVTENGIADANDDQRAAYIVQHVQALERARADGADVRGYIHWTLMDNFEWVRGYAPKFGLLQVDHTDPAKTRHITNGARIFREVIEANGVTPDLAKRYGE